MKLLCTHKGRSIGQTFQRCLVCGSWSFTVGGRWYPESVIMPWRPHD